MIQIYWILLRRMNSAQNMNKVMMMIYIPCHWGLLYPILLLYCVDPGDPRRPDRERRERREPRIAVR